MKRVRVGNRLIDLDSIKVAEFKEDAEMVKGSWRYLEDLLDLQLGDYTSTRLCGEEARWLWILLVSDPCVFSQLD